MRHHIGDQKNHNKQRYQRHDGRVQGGTHQLGLQRLLLFEVVGQALEHQAELAALLAGIDYRHKGARKLAWVLCQRPGKGGAPVDLGPQARHQIALRVLFGFVGQRAQRPLQRQAGGYQPGELAGPDAQVQRFEHPPAAQRFTPAHRVARAGVASLGAS